MFKVALDAAQTSPYARGVERWILAGKGIGARVAVACAQRFMDQINEVRGVYSLLLPGEGSAVTRSAVLGSAVLGSKRGSTASGSGAALWALPMRPLHATATFPDSYLTVFRCCYFLQVAAGIFFSYPLHEIGQPMAPDPADNSTQGRKGTLASNLVYQLSCPMLFVSGG